MQEDVPLPRGQVCVDWAEESVLGQRHEVVPVPGLRWCVYAAKGRNNYVRECWVRNHALYCVDRFKHASIGMETACPKLTRE